IFPRIINVAVPSPQHSPIFGQLPEVQIVFRLYLSTKPRSSVYFCPVGSFTLSHFGLGCAGCFCSKMLCIFLIFRKAKVRKKYMNVTSDLRTKKEVEHRNAQPLSSGLCLYRI